MIPASQVKRGERKGIYPSVCISVRIQKSTKKNNDDSLVEVRVREEYLFLSDFGFGSNRSKRMHAKSLRIPQGFVYVRDTRRSGSRFISYGK